jgi:hypothetical protein
MAYKGRIKGGVVVMEDKSIDLPEGMEVEVRVTDREDSGLTLYERLEPVIGIAGELPSDLAENHDRYAHGRPKE